MLGEITDKIISLAGLNCPNCGAAVSVKDFSSGGQMFKCSHCNSFFAAGNILQEKSEFSYKPRPEIPMPEKMSVSQSDGYYTITRKWFSPVFIFLIFFTMFWNGFMITWHSNAISSGQYIMSIFGILHTAVGIFLIYITLAGFINRTDIKLGRGKLIIKHSPLWWPGSGNYTLSEFEQFYSTEKITRGKNGTTYTYELKGKTVKGSSVKILGGLQNPEQALFLEQKIENYTGIKDSPMAGELPR